MSGAERQFQIKLPPALGAVLVVVLLAGAGGLYLARPELAKQLWGEFTDDRFEYLTEEKYLPEIEQDLRVHLESAVVRHLVANQATEAQFRQAKPIEILQVRANPVGFYRFEHNFWHSSEVRRVDLEVTFTAGGTRCEAEGEMSVSGRQNLILVTNVDLVTGL